MDILWIWLHRIIYWFNLNKFNHALRPYFLTGKFSCLLATLVICFVFWWVVNLLLTALVSFDLKKTALFDEWEWSFPSSFDLYFWLRMVRFLAIFFLTVFIFASLVALPDEALEFLKVLSSSLSFSMLARMASLSLSLILWHTFFSTIFNN